MNKIKSTRVIIFLFLTMISHQAFSQGYEWVTPGSYEFGSCGNVKGVAVPGSIGVERKYYYKSNCLSDYVNPPVDRCLQHAQQIQSSLESYGTLSKCSRWLKNELSSCRSFIKRAGKWCYKLAR